MGDRRFHRPCRHARPAWLGFNSNLDVIDDAFEYLVNKSSKGEKGQYFTPRWVIDLCVKMLNPQENETLIDTACGSAGFTVHAIFHVWRAILEDMSKDQSHLFTMEEKPQRCKRLGGLRGVFGRSYQNVAGRVVDGALRRAMPTLPPKAHFSRLRAPASRGASREQSMARRSAPSTR